MTPAARSPAATWLDTSGPAFAGRLLLDGALVPARGGGTFDVAEPATGRRLGAAARGDAADVAAAVASSRAAQRQWADVPALRRGRMLADCGRALSDSAEILARTCTLETGKAIRTESRPEAEELARIFSFFGGLAGEAKGETIPFAPNVLSMSVREPIGVVGAIVPWNAPMLLAALKIAPALATGNAVVLKSSELAPFAVLRMVEIVNAVLPPGVLNVVSGHGPEVGASLASHPDVGKVSFTGSVEVGRAVYRAAAERIVPVTLELGGKSPMLVFADCDLARAVEGAVASMRFTRQGQSCTAASRIYVQRGVLDGFVEALVASLGSLVLGDPTAEGTDVGALVSTRQRDRIAGYLDEARRGGTARVVEVALAGRDVDPAGAFMMPHVVVGPGNDDRIVREELFGPVTCVIPFDGAAEALELANDTSFGLSASVWTRDLSIAMTLARRLEAGIVQVNQNLVVQPNVGVGGHKLSGLGHEGTLDAMVKHFTRRKSILVRTD